MSLFEKSVNKLLVAAFSASAWLFISNLSLSLLNMSFISDDQPLQRGAIQDLSVDLHSD